MASEAANELASMTLDDAQLFSHGPCNNGAEWKSQLQTLSGLPGSYALTKTLVFKPSRAPSILTWQARTPLTL